MASAGVVRNRRGVSRLRRLAGVPESGALRFGRRGALPRRQVGFTAAVSLFNPHAILDTVGVIGTSALAYEGEQRWVFAGSVVTVSWLWFVSLAASGRLLGRTESDAADAVLGKLDAAAALVIWGVAGYMAYRFLTL
ncbi:LysE/ArgO family amino acid transporter [Salinigranum rubrum]|uniref:LysE/ArgO family amino acid transporter n=1 Tax=Salinigranum rubrum TaxID=755307 RepID=UPI002481E9C5|nr:LysE family transporter [Salinigranum rubrum]